MLAEHGADGVDLGVSGNQRTCHLLEGINKGTTFGRAQGRAAHAHGLAIIQKLNHRSRGQGLLHLLNAQLGAAFTAIALDLNGGATGEIKTWLERSLDGRKPREHQAQNTERHQHSGDAEAKPAMAIDAQPGFTQDGAAGRGHGCEEAARKRDGLRRAG